MEIGFKLDLDLAAKASQGGKLGTGVSKVEIAHAWVSKTQNGNNLLDLELIGENGEIGFINRLCIDQKWTSGSENLDYKRWQELAAACRMQTLTLVDSKRNTKNGEVDAKEIQELIGKVVKVAIYEEFDVYNNKEKLSLRLQNTFLADGRSIAEVQANKPAERIEKIAERLRIYETPEYKQWKNGTRAIDNVVAEEICEPDSVMSEEKSDDLFG